MLSARLIATHRYLNYMDFDNKELSIIMSSLATFINGLDTSKKEQRDLIADTLLLMDKIENYTILKNKSNGTRSK